MSREEITVAFLDVGQGDSTVIILPDSSSAIIVDCPSKPTTINYLEQKGINNLHVFLTHTDLDHIGGTATLVENIEQINTFAYNHDTLLVAKDNNKRRIILRHLAQLIDRRGLNTYSPRTGHHWSFQGVMIEALHPDDQDIKRTVPRGDTNNASIMLRVSFAQRRVLLTADIEGQGWKWIMERHTDLQADVLKFPHHGAWYEAKDEQPTLEEILQRVNPSLVVISVGTNNSHKHPRTKTFQVLRTYAQLRFMCTEATERCYSMLNTKHKGTFPCAGTVEVIIQQKGIEVAPDLINHSKVISSFDRAQCKMNTRSISAF